MVGVTGLLSVTVINVLHPSLSVTIQVYVPAISPVSFWVVSPLLQLYVYGCVPPVGYAVMFPLDKRQSGFVSATATPYPTFPVIITWAESYLGGHEPSVTLTV